MVIFHSDVKSPEGIANKDVVKAIKDVVKPCSSNTAIDPKQQVKSPKT